MCSSFQETDLFTPLGLGFSAAEVGFADACISCNIPHVLL